MKNVKTINALTWMRGIAALLVVGFHCHITMLLPKYFGSSDLSFFVAGNSGVQLFFVLSGFVLFAAHQDDPQGNIFTLKKFAFKRFRRVFPLLWAVLLLVTLVMMLGIFGERPTFSTIVLAFFAVPTQSETILAVEWTLRHELLFYALFIIFIWSRRIGLTILVLWGIFGSGFALMTNGNWIIEFVFNHNHALFLMGMFVAWLHFKYRQGGPLALIFGVSIFAIAYTYRLQNPSVYDWVDVAFGVGASGIIYGLSGTKFSEISIKYLDNFGNSSYALYLIHYPIISALVKIATILNRHIQLPNSVYFFLIIFICQVMALIVHKFVEQPLISYADEFSLWIKDHRRRL